ncbi:MAG: M20/M25/M40 family metallo-hydrolase [Dehalococcoidia bacterium]|nr:M20/M25/M40 family metallo-hydrolase [Dehalococcoidia bacterium]
MSSPIDWSATAAEALEVLRAYLRIDTSNPPGGEAPAARYLGGVLEAEGIACEYVETAPGREAVAARLPGDGSRRALMLSNHLDVVPVQREFWTVDPFGAEVRDGRIYGRGAVDMKSVGVMHLFAMVLSKRLALPLRRDLVFLAAPDEETGSDRGMVHLLKHRPDLFEGVEYSLNEGSSGMDAFGGAPAHLFEVAVTEKAMSPLRLRVVGTPGHGSKPAYDNPVLPLMRALRRLSEWDRPLRFTDATRDYVARLHEAGLIADDRDASAIEAAVKTSPDTEAAFTDTLNVTIVRAGNKNNIIPAVAEAELDCRLLAGHDPEDWRRQVVERIDDPRVEVSFIYDHEPLPAVSPWDTDLARVIQEVLLEAFEDAVVVPATSTVGTDNRFLRPRGITSYGFIPCLLSQAERDGFHGNDEFLTLDNFNMGLEVMFEVVRRIST